MSIRHNRTKPRKWTFPATLCAAALALPLCANAEQIDPTAFSSTFKVSFPGYNGGATLTDFPALVRLSPELNAFNYAKCKVANGGDIRFADSNGNLIPHEIDTWNPSGTSLVWVKVPSFNKNTEIRAYYGCDNPPAVNPQDVWNSGYVAVWHLNETGKTMTDSSCGGTALKEANKSGTTDSILSGQTGLFGNSVEFGVLEGHTGSLAASGERYKTAGTSNFTVEFWSYQDGFNPTNIPNNMVYMREVESAKQNYIWNFNTVKTTSYGYGGKSVVQVSREDGQTVTLSTGTTTPARGEWTYQYFRTADTVKFYEGMNGSPNIAASTTSPVGVTNHNVGTTVYIGNGGITSTGAFQGKIDEVRISNVARSDDWMKANYDMGTNEDFVFYEMDNNWKKYSHKLPIAFTNYTGTTTLENFPVLVKLAEYDETTGTGIRGFRYSDFQKANGGDLRFADENGTLLASEVEVWNTSGESVVWVRLPTLVPSAANEITAYYGWMFAPHVDTAQVWNNGYTAVWHLNGDETGMVDSTCGGTTLKEHSDNAGKNRYGQEGIVGTAVEFDHDGNHKGGLETRDSRYSLIGLESFTIEAWAKQDVYDPDVNPLNRYMAYMAEAQYSSPWVTPWSWRDIKTGAGKNGKTCFTFLDGSLKADGTSDPKYLQNNNRTPPWKQWNYQVLRYNGSQYVHNLNTEQLATLSCNSITNVLPTALYVGNSSRGGSEAYSGKLDEVRISSVRRSDDWIKATYDTIKDNAAFTRYGVASQNVYGFLIIVR